MEEIAANFWIGIISGLVATGLTMMIQFFWVKGFIPWFEERIYKDAQIEGTWQGVIEQQDGKNAETLELRLVRKSHAITGEMIASEPTKNQPLANKDKRFIVSGEFRNMILTLSYSSINLSEVDRGCLAFKLKKNGRSLEGGIVYYLSPEDKIVTASVNLERES